MAVSASLDVRFAKEVSVQAVLKKLLKAGWTLQDDDGNTMYLPEDDRGRYDWSIGRISPDDYLKIVRKQEKAGDPAGVSLSWMSTGIGGEFLFLNPQELFIVLSLNRQVLAGSSMTDMSWYLEKIVLLLEQAGVRVGGFSCQHHE